MTDETTEPGGEEPDAAIGGEQPAESETETDAGAEEAAAEAEHGGGEETDADAAVAPVDEHDGSEPEPGLPVATQLGNADDDQPVDDGA